jgi:hypothetical protein
VSEGQKPQWLPLNKLPLIASMIDGMLADTEEQYQKLLEARPRPHVLDDYTVGRVTKLYGDQRQDVALYAQQVARWADQPLTPAQREEVERLQAQMKKLGEVTATILSLAEELKPRTIDRLLAKSGSEVGQEFLPPRRRA